MANQSYCRWENTSKDMQDCVNSLHDVDDVQEWFTGLDDYEREGVKRALRLARFLVEELEPQIEQD